MLNALVNGEPAGSLPLSDRGLAYGDGLFETMLAVAARIALWPRHFSRLSDACGRLGIACPPRELLEREIALLCAGSERVVVKLILTAGGQARGYARSAASPPTRILLAYPAPVVDAALYREGVRVRWCETRYARQPRLAGIKHLNRLEQVLARAEWDDPDVHEGLMLDSEGRLVSATAANVFVGVDGRLVTPSVERCGVAGVMRAHIIDQPPLGQAVEVRDILPSLLDGAAEVFLTNAVRHVVPVCEIAGRRFVPGPISRALADRCRRLESSMECSV